MCQRRHRSPHRTIIDRAHRPAATRRAEETQFHMHNLPYAPFGIVVLYNHAISYLINQIRGKLRTDAFDKI